LLISMPHVGTHVPPALAARFTDEAQRVLDTGGHLIKPVDGSFGGITASRLAKMDSDGGLVGDTVGQVFSSCGIWKSRARPCAMPWPAPVQHFKIGMHLARQHCHI
jgi:hypothetical protein